MSMSVGKVARMAGVSVRTLHHYDETGLLTPSERTRSGYRRYTDADLERLFAIRLYRELGFDLAGIRRILDDPSADPLQLLEAQRDLLNDRIGQLARMRQGVERMMNAKQSGLNLSSEEMQEIFGDFDPKEHEAEARERWGDTEAFQESRRRTAAYRKEDWVTIRAEVEGIEAAMAEALEGGEPSGSAEAMRLAEEHRKHISRWFYECTSEIHRGLADMYESDRRFADYYDGRSPGLSRWLSDAIRANATMKDEVEG